MTLDEFKKENPAYKDVPDKDLAEGLYRNVYAKTGITKEDFYDKIGLSDTAPREETFGSVASRIGSGQLGLFLSPPDHCYGDYCEQKQQ